MYYKKFVDTNLSIEVAKWNPFIAGTLQMLSLRKLIFLTRVPMTYALSALLLIAEYKITKEYMKKLNVLYLK